jgi:hypothetical protein
MTVVATAAMAILAVAGCGNSADPADRVEPGGEVVTSQPTRPEPSNSPRPAGRGQLRTIRGTIQPGVESGCLILSTDEGVFQLVGAPTAGLKAGMTVEVSGTPDDTIVTTCQQGTPFVVVKMS